MANTLPALLPAGLAGDGEARLYLRFTLNDEAFAIHILQIREIIEYGQLTEVPMMPAFIRGVINLRGAVVPVIDLSARFERARTQVGRRTCVVILEAEAEGDGESPLVLGIMVDAVNEVLEIPAADIEPPPSFGARLRTDFIAGMGRVAGRFVVILDLPRVLAMDELARLSEAGRTASHEAALAP